MKSIRYYQILVFTVLIVLIPVRSDLPVHCVKDQIIGSWEVQLEKPTLTGMGPLPCGHNVPDDKVTSQRAYIQQFKKERSIDVILNEDNSVTNIQDLQKGEWTMVYDEGFEFSFENTKYFAFSKYQANGQISQSFCDETLIGWYNHLTNGERGCYRAVKKKESEKQSETILDFLVRKSHCFKFKQVSSEQTTKEWHNQIVNQLNKVNFQNYLIYLRQNNNLWKAVVYDEYVGLSTIEFNELAGRRRHYKGKRSPPVYHSHKKASISNSFLEEDLPADFSWKQHLSEARRQQNCGSCYAISAMAMFSARLKIQGENVNLSPQFSLNCNYYNQGCHGGYSYLVGKFASEQYIVPEHVDPYKGQQETCDYRKVEMTSKVYQVNNYRYVGGAYGKVSEKEIMAEIMKNGPVVMSFEPPHDFMYYRRGIYKAQAENSSANQKWEKVDHSVLCFGWGEDDGVKFWHLQNSWGPNWGENGNFRMIRGIDELGIESMVEAGDPVVIKRDFYNFNSQPTISNTDPNENQRSKQEQQKATQSRSQQNSESLNEDIKRLREGMADDPDLQLENVFSKNQDFDDSVSNPDLYLHNQKFSNYEDRSHSIDQKSGRLVASKVSDEENKQTYTPEEQNEKTSNELNTLKDSVTHVIGEDSMRSSTEDQNIREEKKSFTVDPHQILDDLEKEIENRKAGQQLIYSIVLDFEQEQKQREQNQGFLWSADEFDSYVSIKNTHLTKNLKFDQK